jgi:4-alpha-glucanotransferase
MDIDRSAGVLLHPTSLPGKFGIGDLGPNAYRFVDFLNHSGQTLWQTFPLGPTGYGDSPYQCFSAFAGNPLLISPEILIKELLLNENEIGKIPEYDQHKIDYGSVINFKYELLRKAFENFKAGKKSYQKEYDSFCSKNAYWLDDYSLFMAAKDYHGGNAWPQW